MGLFSFYMTSYWDQRGSLPGVLGILYGKKTWMAWFSFLENGMWKSLMLTLITMNRLYVVCWSESFRGFSTAQFLRKKARRVHFGTCLPINFFEGFATVPCHTNTPIRFDCILQLLVAPANWLTQLVLLYWSVIYFEVVMHFKEQIWSVATTMVLGTYIWHTNHFVSRLWTRLGLIWHVTCAQPVNIMWIFIRFWKL